MNFDLISLSLLTIASLAIFIDKPENLFNKTKKIKLGSFEWEIQELNKETEVVEKNIDTEKTAPVGLSGSRISDIQNEYKISEDFGIEILKLSVNIEKTLREIYDIHFKKTQEKPFAITKLIETLSDEKVIDVATSNMLRKFWALRNQVIHNYNFYIDKKDFISFTDIGIRILKILNNIKNDKLDGKLQHYGLS